MTSGEEKMRELEAAYDNDMPDRVRHYADSRNDGIRLVRHGERATDTADGLHILSESVRVLGEHSDKDDPYHREYYASLYMWARGLCLAGRTEMAGAIAQRAMKAQPRLPEGLPSEVVADQYVAIASAKLSVVLSASVEDGVLPMFQDLHRAKLATRAAGLAAKTCLHSESGRRMYLANGEESFGWRLNVRRKHATAAAGAIAGLWLPGQAARVRLAQRLCA